MRKLVVFLALMLLIAFSETAFSERALPTNSPEGQRPAPKKIIHKCQVPPEYYLMEAEEFYKNARNRDGVAM